MSDLYITSMPAMAVLFTMFTVGFAMMSAPFSGRPRSILRTLSATCFCMAIMFGLASVL